MVSSALAAEVRRSIICHPEARRFYGKKDLAVESGFASGLRAQASACVPSACVLWSAAPACRRQDSTPLLLSLRFAGAPSFALSAKGGVFRFCLYRARLALSAVEGSVHSAVGASAASLLSL